MPAISKNLTHVQKMKCHNTRSPVITQDVKKTVQISLSYKEVL